MTSLENGYSIFHQPWWWDLMAANAWDEVVIEVDQKVRARWPYVVSKQFGLVRIAAPPLVKWSGPWVDAGDGKPSTQLDRTKTLLDELVTRLPKHDWFSQNLHAELTYWLPLYWNRFDVSARVSCELRDTSDEAACWSQLSESTRRAIRKARKQVVVQPIDADGLLRILRATYDRQGRKVPAFTKRLDAICAAVVERGVGEVLGAVDEKGQIHAATLFVRDANRMYYLVGGGDPALRSSGAASLLLWEGITRAVRDRLIFDFEGSMVEPIERFFRGFGALPRPYMNIKRTSRMLRIADALTRSTRASDGGA